MVQNALVRKLHESLEVGSFKRQVGEIVESRKVEILIIFLVCCDVILLGIEGSVDHHLVCIDGQVAPVAPAELRALGNAHGAHHSAASFFGEGEVGSRRQKSGRGKSWLSVDEALSGSYAQGLMFLQEPSHEHAHEHTEGHEEAHGGDHAGHGHGHVDAALVCETKHGPQSHEIEHFCHRASITILVIFMVEILTKLWVHPKEFMRSPVEVLDLVVVSLSLFVDVFIIPIIKDPKNKSDVSMLVMLLIVCRFWRVVRIFHGLFAVVHSQIEREEKLTVRIEDLEAEIRRYDPGCPVLSEHKSHSRLNVH